MTSKGSSENGSVTSLEKDGPAGPGIIIIQICVVLLFMAGLVGAFYYAINSAEVDPEKIHHEWKLSQNYSALFSQFSSKLGKFTLTVKPSDKMEDHDKKEIVHKINNDTIAYALADFTFWVKLDQKQQPKECLEDEKGGYLDYIQKLGLFEMEDRHTAIARIRDSKAVYVYDVHPKPDKFLHEHGYLKGDALLVQAYVDKETGTFLGWQTYFTAADNASHHLRRTEYWFPDMEQETPPEDAFKQIPSICYPAR
ncbi:hypothetical protein Ddc_09201 [Ditylenchus destructor]|nr:hypothetical protein Ddc_09201 [Ditylenchus destructor]